MSIRFGMAGNSLEYLKYNKTSINIPKWLNMHGLNAFEYQCGHGINISDKNAILIGNMSKKYDVSISIHAPYFINLANNDLFEKNFNYIYNSIIKVQLMNGNKIVIHCGSLLKNSRKEALDNVKNNLKKIINRLYDLNLKNFFLCIETMGKINTLGSLNEVLEIISIDECLLPCIDFGHLYARSLGKINNYFEFENIFNIIKANISNNKIQKIHCHFSKIKFSDKGEVKHLTYDDLQYGPNFDDIAKILKNNNYCPTIICESKNVQDKDAVKLKEIYLNIL